MCGKGAPKWTLPGIVHELSTMSSKEWNQFSPSGNTFDRVYGDWTKIHDPLNVFGGVKPTVDSWFGVAQREAKREGDRIEGRLYWQSLQKTEAPEKSAMEIYDAAEVRNRRRRAALLGIQQLRTPSGPGTATGGGYSGVGGGMY